MISVTLKMGSHVPIMSVMRRNEIITLSLLKFSDKIILCPYSFYSAWVATLLLMVCCSRTGGVFHFSIRVVFFSLAV